MPTEGTPTYQLSVQRPPVRYMVAIQIVSMAPSVILGYPP